ncbi:ABC transporter permease [Vagococcus sp.]|uniref:ABC transporter permease n=1 Tax=Vagococcus sp. TaxID=1933889 RepID=UPI003F99164F
MFLAFNEIRYSKLKYLLVTSVIFLIAYLVFFLTGLAYGLAQDNRSGVDKWEADYLLITKEANDNLNLSLFPDTLIKEVKAKDKALLSQSPGVITNEKSQTKVNISLFGIDSQQFITPNIKEGRLFSAHHETVVDESLKNQYGFKLGDKVLLTGQTDELTIVGFTDHAKYNTAPILYLSINDFQDIRFGSERQNNQINAIVTRGNTSKIPKTLKKTTIANFIKKIPGYNAQILTFGLMIGFLIAIAAIIIGIFIYVLTMQKIEVFGVLKAQGISNRYISTSIINQTFLLAFTGVMVGLLASLLTGSLLPKAVPFQINLLFFSGICLLMILTAVIGAFFSVKTIIKIDPLKMIG